MKELTIAGAGGVKLRARAFEPPNRGAPGLLLHHGLASSQHIWDLMIPALTRRFAVVTYDARGHGLSSKPSSGYGFDRIVADVLAVAEGTGLRRPVFAGHSWGAMAGLELAAHHPRKIAGAMLIDGGVAGPQPDWKVVKELLRPPPLAGTPVEEFRRSMRRWSPVRVTPELEASFMSLMNVRAGKIYPRLSLANHMRILRKIWEQRPMELYPLIRVPVLSVLADSGAQDGFTKGKREALRTARAAASGRPVTFVWMKGVHDLPIHHPEALCRLVERFADQVLG
jgi:pimeloyl-ACP methyl ester carboxylesterase